MTLEDYVRLSVRFFKYKLHRKEILEDSYCVCFCYEIFYLIVCLYFIRKEDWLVKSNSCLCVCACRSLKYVTDFHKTWYEHN